jgi:hypothetical protein
MGVPVIKSLKPKHDEIILNWIENGKVIDVSYPDNTKEILEHILERHFHPALSLLNA